MSDTTTEGIRIRIKPSYWAERSEPEHNQFAFTYTVTISNVGTEPSDATIGRYLAGFLAELSSPDKKNWIETKVEPGYSATGEPVSICTLILRHEYGDDRWGWGVRFHVRSSDGLVLNGSFTCVGAG